MKKEVLPETAIIIRTRNEERWIGTTLKQLAKQTYQNFEIIIVDSGSTDSTLEIAKRYDTNIVQISPEDFTYPYAINVGIKNAHATKYFCILSAHSIPTHKYWLESGIKKFSLQNNICGVYGPIRALPDGTFWDKAFYNISYLLNWCSVIPKSYKIVTKGKMGVLGFTNAVVRRDLWEKYQFNEKFAAGGEDGDWAQYWLSHGYVIVRDMHFTVLHSHYLNLRQWKAQFQYWKGLTEAKPFVHLPFRKEDSHKPL